MGLRRCESGNPGEKGMLWEARKDNAGEQVGIQHQAQNGGRITPRFCKLGETESWRMSSSSPCLALVAKVLHPHVLGTVVLQK